jgi:hypothetical protein
MIQPDVPVEFSSVIGLGVVKALYSVRKTTRWSNLVIAVFCLPGSAVVFLFGLWQTYTMWQQHGSAFIGKTIFPYLIFAGLLLLVGLATAWGAYDNWQKLVVIYQHGFAYRDRRGIQTYRWDEIESFFSAVTKHYTNGVYTGTTHVYTILKKDRADRLVLNDAITKVEEVANQIRDGAYPLMYKRCADTYNSGQQMTFGPVTISKSGGIQINKKNYPWDQVARVTLHQGSIQVAKKGGGWFSGASVAAAMVPNVEILLSVIDQVVGLKTK